MISAWPKGYDRGPAEVHPPGQHLVAARDEMLGAGSAALVDVHPEVLALPMADLYGMISSWPKGHDLGPAEAHPPGQHLVEVFAA